jgi:hypothetical protein
MKKYRIIFWVSTTLIFLFEGVVPALTANTELAKQGIAHLGFPDYFRVQLIVFKVLGTLALILPFVPSRLKEWAYAGFTFNFLSAFIATWAVDGLSGLTFFPLIVLAVLAASYVSYHKLGKAATVRETREEKTVAGMSKV